jgi:hypothetical protein
VDVKKLTQADKGKRDKYLSEVKADYQKEQTVAPQVMTFGQFMESEKEKSDMYLFVKYFCPILYNKYVRVTSVEGAALEDQQL